MAAQTYPPAKLEVEVIEWTEKVTRQSDELAAQSSTLKLIPKIIQYLGGQQWPSRPTAYGSSRPVNNRMFRQYWELISLLTDGKPIPEIKCYDTDDGYSEIQTLLGKLISIWGKKPEYHDAIQDIIGFGLLAHGVGKVQWNSKLNGGLGDVQLLSINPLNLYILGGDGSIEGAELIREDEMVTLASLKRQYGNLADLVDVEAENTGIASIQTMKPSALSSSEWSKLSPYMRQVMGVKRGGIPEMIFPMVKKRQFWFLDPATNETSSTIPMGINLRTGRLAPWGYMVEPGMQLYPRGRLIVTAGKRVMNDTCNPYYHAQFPYIDFTPLKTGFTSDGMSLMGNQIGPQDILNRIMAGLLETVKAGLIPTIITPRNSISRADLDNISTTISGGKLEYNPNSASPPTFRPQPQIPTLAMQFAQMVKQEMDESTGSAAVDSAAQKDQIPSHDTMELIQNSRSSLVRVMGRALERFITRGGQLVTGNILQFYSLGHRVALLGEKGISSSDFKPLYGSLLSNGLAPEDFIRKFQFGIEPGSALSFDKDNKAQMAMVLRRAGDLSKENMFRALDANIDLVANDKELLQEALVKMGLANMANAQQMQAKAAADAIKIQAQAQQGQGGGGGGQ
jgi:hypothetical protein